MTITAFFVKKTYTDELRFCSESHSMYTLINGVSYCSTFLKRLTVKTKLDVPSLAKRRESLVQTSYVLDLSKIRYSTSWHCKIFKCSSRGAVRKTFLKPKCFQGGSSPRISENRLRKKRFIYKMDIFFCNIDRQKPLSRSLSMTTPYADSCIIFKGNWRKLLAETFRKSRDIRSFTVANNRHYIAKA